ncbi:MAG: FtsX-like permease family protein [Cyclobacteriaceae bacterium]
MLRNYIVTALRNLKRNKLYALLNVFGLALGIGCAIVIYKVINYENSFDRHHSKFDNIYRVVRVQQKPEGIKYDGAAPHPLGNALREEYPSIEKVAIVNYQPDMQITIEDDAGNKQMYREETGVTFAQEEIFEILDFEWIAGDPTTVIRNPREAVLSTEWANKFFGLSEETAHMAVGKTVTVQNNLPLKIVGVYKSFPETTDMAFRMVATYESLAEIDFYFYEGKAWHSISSTTNCMVLLNAETHPADLERQFPDFIEKYSGDRESNVLSMQMQPLSDLHFSQNFDNWGERSANKELLLALAIIGLVLILAAAINFINLATAQAVKRSKEIGIRKVMGGYRTQLIVQFLSETFIITLLAVIVSLGVAELLMINLVDVLTYRLHLNLLDDISFSFFLIAITFFVALLSGLYPAFLLSRMDAVSAIKSKINSFKSTGGFSLRRTLVIIQFGISQLLIVCTLIVGSQMEYFSSKELGFEHDAILITYLPDNELQTLDRLRENLIRHSQIENVSFNLSAPTGQSVSTSNFNYVPANIETDPDGNFKLVDEHYIDLYGLNVIAGRKLMKTDTSGVLVNEEIVKMMGVGSPEAAVGEELRCGYGGYKGLQIVGVVENFHSRSLANSMEYVVLMKMPQLFYEAGIQLNISEANFESIKEAREIVQKEWEASFPNFVFESEFLDEQLEERYENEASVSQLLQIFSLIAIFIGCLGLYGLITFLANQKNKEIGVRKVLGATVGNILAIFSKELLLLMVVAFVIAAPISYLAMNNWLQEFEYHITIGVDIFLLAIVVSLVIAIATMGYRSVKAATANPAESLKDE